MCVLCTCILCEGKPNNSKIKTEGIGRSRGRGKEQRQQQIFDIQQANKKNTKLRKNLKPDSIQQQQQQKQQHIFRRGYALWLAAATPALTSTQHRQQLLSRDSVFFLLLSLCKRQQRASATGAVQELEVTGEAEEERHRAKENEKEGGQLKR